MLTALGKTVVPGGSASLGVRGLAGISVVLAVAVGIGVLAWLSFKCFSVRAGSTTLTGPTEPAANETAREARDEKDKREASGVSEELTFETTHVTPPDSAEVTKRAARCGF